MRKYRSLAIPPFSVEAEGWCFLKQEDVREATLTCMLTAVTHVLTKVRVTRPCDHMHQPRDSRFFGPMWKKDFPWSINRLCLVKTALAPDVREFA